jgi:ADP-ribose pyrophosphatase YjhB (NUDIX family)
MNIDSSDIGFVHNDRRFRYRAAAIIIEGGCVLMAKNSGADYFYSVGGAVQLGESAEDAVKREVFEETGVDYAVDRLAFVHENFFTFSAAETGTCEMAAHELSLYFLMKPQGTKQLPFGTNAQTFHEWQTGRIITEKVAWLPIDTLGERHLFPIFFKTRLNPLPDKVEHIVTWE